MHNDIKDEKKLTFLVLYWGILQRMKFFHCTQLSVEIFPQNITLLPYFSSLCNAKLGRKGEEKN